MMALRERRCGVFRGDSQRMLSPASQRRRDAPRLSTSICCYPRTCDAVFAPGPMPFLCNCSFLGGRRGGAEREGGERESLTINK
jgi:hypothetical protein